ncbi:MAG TPA: ribose-phosphate pyrophosphokinase [Blastocatellia bacterium]|nr:ribose-phosphate pyrophosphokinase [Blastocatellia bacterium]
MKNLALFAGSSVPELAASVASQLGIRLSDCAIQRFPDGETWVAINEPVRGRDVFIIQSTSPPVNDTLIELLAFADASRRASAASVTAIVPYFGYSRQDKRHGRREPVTARMVADLIQSVGVGHLVTVDLHTPQIEGFFHIPVDDLTAVPTLCKTVEGRLPKDVVVVSPDAGRVKMASRYAEKLGARVAVLHKRRESPSAAKVTQVVGDVKNRACLIIDDMISTGGTLSAAVDALLESGARGEIYIAATHGVFAEGARQALDREALRSLIVTNTIPVSAASWPALEIVSLANLLADAIRRFVSGGSVSDLY